jgi:PUA domain protein
MFNAFNLSTDISTSTPCKSSVQRGMCTKILEQYPELSKETLELALPKTSQAMLIKGKDNVTFIVSPILKYPIFFQIRDGPFIPTLRFLHSAGNFMSILGVDKGGIPFVLKGANIFTVGITSQGGSIPNSVEAGVPVQIMAEGKELPLSVGITKISTQEMKTSNTGTAVEQLHFLGDGLWRALHKPWI